MIDFLPFFVYFFAIISSFFSLYDPFLKKWVYIDESITRYFALYSSCCLLLSLSCLLAYTNFR